MTTEELKSDSAAAKAGAGTQLPAKKPVRRISRGTKIFFCAVLLVAVLYAARYPLMSVAASAWIVNDEAVKSDAVVVLGGGLDSRPSFASDLYRRGLVSVVLVSDVRDGPAADKGVLPRETNIAISLLEKEGVPKSAIQTFGSKVSSTRDEAQGVLAWVEQHPSHRIIVPTDPFHTRRVKWLFSRVLRDQHVEVSVASIPNARYDTSRWWNSEEATIAFQNEVIKFVYYWLHY